MTSPGTTVAAPHSPSAVPSRVRTWLHGVAPTPFWAAALLGALLVWVLGTITVWLPWSTETTVLSQGWPFLIDTWSRVLWTLAPLVALRAPRLAAALVAAPLVVLVGDADPSWPVTCLASGLAVVLVVAWARPRLAAAYAVVLLVLPVGFATGLVRIVVPYSNSVDYSYGVDPGSAAFTLLLYALTHGVVLGVGLVLRTAELRARREAAVEGRAAQVDRDAATLGERARLARDLHDVVAHHISLIAVRAETAPYTVDDLSAQGRALLAEIAADSRRALDELRGVLGVLQRSSQDAERAPQPGAADLSGLVAAARDAGDDVVWHRGDVPGLADVAPTTGYVAYRVVQEALTNARRHAPGARVEITIRTGPAGALTVRVANPAGRVDPVVPGRGLTGMRERVEALGGRLDVSVDRSRTEQGLFVVLADLPGADPDTDDEGEDAR